ncbi:nucleoside triphosphate pyrophosphohydrolase [Thermanaerosceptrum fracticalcis]|uniref:Nucleoside triphosphate pyrophosphohydrolase n=1 Tax=Thermanaerosceptrum fracticalcis TaxID=1712410 RepID=A0A7G6E5L9_THEFR|nr:nucleoside triphosphate pyrophosphohydrolase [Thermanaerosceptrum fracticalcis]QNB47373.1 nucleoside triphosphate pyrophosphohydrolase [Thermanaerosceptrum fracticalcis]
MVKEIVVAGLGPGSLDHLSFGVWQLLQKGDRRIILRTAKHPVVAEMDRYNINYESCDRFYEEKDTFYDVYQAIVGYLIETVKRDSSLQQLIYCVPGHPTVAEETVRMLLARGKEEGVTIRLIPSMSFLDSLYAALTIDPTEGLLVLDALRVEESQLNTGQHTIFTQVYNRLVSSDLKLILLERYPPEHPVKVISSAGIPGIERISEVPLYQLDHINWFDHLTSVYVPPLPGEVKEHGCKYPLDPLVEVMETLLSPRGCPWDREQNHFTLKPYLLEEAYEVIEAIDSGDMHKLREELGDLLLQIVFHTALAQSRNEFDHNDVIEEITLKMIRRHPHVFSNVQVKNSQEVLQNWEEIKAKELGKPLKKGRVMDKLNKSLPALLLAEEVQKMVKKVGFDWDDIQGAWDKLTEEMEEAKQAWQEKGDLEGELGDLLFAVVNVARFGKISPEAALLKTIQKFIRRFNYMEEKVMQQNLKWEELDLQKMDTMWEEAKKSGF